MNSQELVQSFIERCEAGTSSEMLASIFGKAVEQLGYRYFAVCSHVDPLDPPPQAMMVHNYPRVWVALHSELKLCSSDPVLQYAERSPFPFFWDAAFRAYPLTKVQKNLLAEAGELGLAHGYTIPILPSWMPGMARASCSVVPEDGNAIDHWSYRAVELMANYLFVACMRQAPWRALESIKLSHRERQCLSLAAEGKDDWTIGQLLNLHEGTVHTYVERAKRRYSVATRMQAVVRALAAGQISFGDVVRAQDGESR